MEDVQPRMRQAAIRARTNLVESSSDESRSGNKDEDYRCAPRRSKSNKIKAYRRRIPREVNVVFADTGVKRRRRASTVNTQVQWKRQRGAAHNVAGISGGDKSNLTPVALPIGTLRASKGGQTSRLRSQVIEASSLDEDSDDLPDIGMVLSHRDASSSKGKRPQESTHERRPKSRRKSSQAGSVPPPPRSLSTLVSSLSPGRGLVDNNSTSPTSISDQFDLSYLNDDYDLELDSVSIGDLCLAKVKAVETTYWPARILEVKQISTGKGKQKKMFRAVYLDMKEKYIPRNQFYTTSQEGFGTCVIGEFESSHVDVVNDLDEGIPLKNTTSTSRSSSRSRSRSLSPVTVESLPILTGPDFCDLPLHHQLPYVFPILKAIMTGEATWALRRHNMYIKGGITRQELKNEGGMRGAVDARNADAFLPLVEKWCLGVRGPNFIEDQTEQTHIEDRHPRNNVHNEGVKLEVDDLTTARHVSEAASSESSCQIVDPHLVIQAQAVTPKIGESVTEEPQAAQVRNSPEIKSTRRESSSPFSPLHTPRTVRDDQVSRKARPRQRGSPDYENLSPLDKVQYCLDVLIPEAFNQILLWRMGERKSVEVMWDNVKEEERLHDRGEELLEETDWVMDIMRLRKMMESSLSKDRSEKEPTSDKTLRRTRSGRVGGMIGCYKE